MIESAGDKLVVVKMGADWCPPCRTLAPLLEKLAAERTDVVLISVDVDKCGEVASKLKVSGIPDTRIFKNRVEVAKVVGCDIQSITTHLSANSTSSSTTQSTNQSTNSLVPKTL
jgi:thioredoxin 1